MIYGTVYGNELTPLAPWLMGQCHYFYFHGIWNQSARLADKSKSLDFEMKLF